MNKTLWNYYKQSADGKKSIDLFNPEPDDAYQAAERIAEFLKNWDKDINPQQFGDGLLIYDVNMADRHLLNGESFSRKSFEALYCNLWSERILPAGRKCNLVRRPLFYSCG